MSGIVEDSHPEYYIPNYSFKKFVTTLHKSIQNLRQLYQVTGDSQCFETGVAQRYDSLEVGTQILKYSHNTWHTQREYRGSVKRRGSNNSKSRRSSKAFEEARRRNECFKCRGPWDPKHSFIREDLSAHTRHLLERGDSSVHILSEIVKDQERSKASDHSASDTDECDEQRNEIDEFDSPFDDIDTGENQDLIESADRSICLTQLSSKMTPTETYIGSSVEYFRPGGWLMQ